VSVSAYEVNGSRLLVPQRVDPERQPIESLRSQPSARDTGHLITPEEFEEDIATALPDHQAQLRRMFEWAVSLRDEGILRLLAFRGTRGHTTLLPYLLNEGAGLITVWNDNIFAVSFWRTVFERRAPASIAPIERLIAPAKIGQGNTVKVVSDELLEALTAAYREAAS
jgi:hypothetical protein